MLHRRSLAFAHLETLKLDTHWKTRPHSPHLSDTDNHCFSASVLQVNGKWKCSDTDKGTLLSLKQRNTATVTSVSLEDKMLGEDSQTQRTKTPHDFTCTHEVSQVIRLIKADNTTVLVYNQTHYFTIRHLWLRRKGCKCVSFFCHLERKVHW